MRWLMIAVCVVVLPLSAMAQSNIPVGEERQRLKKDSHPIGDESAPEAIRYPFFTREGVAPDQTPEDLALTNDPTPEKAREAVRVDVIRAIYAIEARRLKEVERARVARLAAKALGRDFEEGTSTTTIVAALEPTILLLHMASVYNLPVPQSYFDWVKAHTDDKGMLDEITRILLGKVGP